MKHTPAPWRQLVTRIDDARGYQICHVDLHGKSEAERDANRRLIAAAPDLLSALNAMLTQFGMDEDEWSKPTFDQARRAVAKATGNA
jgi:hypothetical protein